MSHLYALPKPMPGEQILHIIHRDVWVALRRVALFVTLLVLPGLLLIFASRFFPSLLEVKVSFIIIILVASAYILFVWLLFFFSIIDYILDIWVITNQRIIDIQQNGFFSRKISEQMLHRVQDLSSDTHGFWQTIWKYGNLTVQTAGQESKFHFEEISNPDHIRDIVMKLAAQAAATHTPPVQTPPTESTPHAAV